MCLEMVEQQWLDPKDTDWKIGYKCYFDSIGSNNLSNIYLYSPQSIHKNKKIVDINKDKFIEMRLVTGVIQNAYPAGFHIWKKLEDAKEHAGYELCSVYKIMYRQVVASGSNSVGIFNADCIVAREIIIKEKVYDSYPGVPITITRGN